MEENDSEKDHEAKEQEFDISQGQDVPMMEQSAFDEDDEDVEPVEIQITSAKTKRKR